MFLSEFHTQVDEIIGEGGASNSLIPGAVRRAVRMLERLYNFRYMRQELLFLYPAQLPTQVDMGVGIKEVISGELRPATGLITEGEMLIEFTDSPHKRLDERRFENRFPVYLKGTRFFTPLWETKEQKTFSLLVYRFTTWPTGGFTSYNHWLLDEAEDLLLHMTIQHLGLPTRDQEMLGFNSELLQGTVKSLFGSGFILDAAE